jgi:hypothetical protein
MGASTPGEGIHSYRFAGLAIVDVVMTIIGAIIISHWANISLVATMSALFALGIVLHRAFDIRTTIDKILFPQ